jgi:hypothetical protein
MAEEISPLEDHGWWMKQLRKDAKANRPEALRLADALEVDKWHISGVTAQSAAEELRRLHAVNGELLEALKSAERAMSNKRFAAEVLEHDSVVREMIRAAIARAEGKV